MLRRLPPVLFALVLSFGVFAETEHTVRSGDTLSALARQYTTSIEAIKERNGLGDDLIRVGQVLVIPDQTGFLGYRLYLGLAGETLETLAVSFELPLASLRSANPEILPDVDLSGIPVLLPPAPGMTVWASEFDTLIGLSARYGIAPSLLATVNGPAGEGIIEAGQPILVPIEPPATGHENTAGDQAPTALGGADLRARHRDLQLSVLARASTLLDGLERVDEVFLYPVTGRLSSAFGWRNISVGGNRFHGGIDIAVDTGTPVLASRQGVVTKAGWGGAYGYVVFIDHGDGSQARYAHLSRIDVGVGETLRQLDRVGLAGSTGASTGPHLHFELRLAGRAVDPLPYLEVATP